MYLHRSFIHYNQKPETQMPIRIAQQIVMYSTSRIKHSTKNKNTNYCNTQQHGKSKKYTEQKETYKHSKETAKL